MKVHRSWLVVVFVLALFGGVLPARADSLIEVVNQNHRIDFGKQIVLELEARSSLDITNITVNYGFGSDSATAYGYPTFTPGREVRAEFTIPTGGAKYMPPGSDVTVTYDIEDQAGNKLRTSPSVFIYQDTRFDWNNVSRDLITVYYYGDDRDSAQRILDTAIGTADRLGKEAGATLTEPVRIWTYASKSDIDPALPFQSETTRRELITLGTAFAEHNLILMIGGRSDPSETVSHEVTHLIVHQAADSPFSVVPAWLNEGFAVYGEGKLPLGSSYLQALQRAIDQNSLIPLRALNAPPGRPDDVILMYGQGYSVVHHLVESYGPDKMRQLLAALKSGNTIDEALLNVYGFDVNGLDDEWRQKIGAEPLPTQSRPTDSGGPAAVPTLPPMTLPGSSAPPTPSGASAAPTTAPEQAPVSESEVASSTGLGGVVAIGGLVLVLVITGAVVISRRR